MYTEERDRESKERRGEEEMGQTERNKETRTRGDYASVSQIRRVA